MPRPQKEKVWTPGEASSFAITESEGLKKQNGERRGLCYVNIHNFFKKQDFMYTVKESIEMDNKATKEDSETSKRAIIVNTKYGKGQKQGCDGENREEEGALGNI